MLDDYIEEENPVRFIDAFRRKSQPGKTLGCVKTPIEAEKIASNMS